jgi:hypothetical protein
MTAARALRAVCMAFLVAETASPARRVEADQALDFALVDAGRVGDLGGLPCPVAFYYAVAHLVGVWRRGSAELRAGRLGAACSASVTAALSYLDGTIEAPWPARSASTGLSRGMARSMGRED